MDRFVGKRRDVPHFFRRRHRLALCCLLAALVVLAGCKSNGFIALREMPKGPLVERLKLTSRKGPEPSPRTMQLLRRYDLSYASHDDPHELLAKLQDRILEEPDAEKYYAFSELAFLAGKQFEEKEPELALNYYGASVGHAYQYLFDPRIGYSRNPYDPQFRGACDLYNGALESVMRIVNKRDGLLPGCRHVLETTNEIWEIDVVANGTKWRAEDFERFEFVSDYEINGLTNQYHTYGLGVPLIAVRKDDPEEAAAETFYPPDLSFAVSAFLQVERDPRPPAAGEKRHHVARLELYDPLNTTDIVASGMRIPLESDLSTPLAFFLDKPELSLISTAGLLRPDVYGKLTGLYMIQPYEPDKIPVVMIHGLWSSPITWMEMFNDLLSRPELRSRYQFWFYLYPTGQPFWISAEQLREDLARVRMVVDPHRQSPAMDQMVLVGHSMGGLLAKMQIVESGNQFWSTVSDQPFQQVKLDSEQRETLADTFFFHPNTSVRRIITLGTPHRGSKFANSATRWLAGKLIHLPQTILDTTQSLYAHGNVKNSEVLQVRTSIDSLAPDSPILPVLVDAPRPPSVKHHNIVGVIEQESWVGSFAQGDGVVAYESAHLDNVDSEIVVDADHLSVHRHPLSVLEVRRILLEHLQQMDREQIRLPGRQWTAEAQLPRQAARADAAAHYAPQESAAGGSRSSVPPPGVSFEASATRSGGPLIVTPN